MPFDVQQTLALTYISTHPLMEYLYNPAHKPEFTRRFRREKSSIAFWDNRAEHHYALNDYQGFCWEMWRVIVEGERPV